MTGGGETTTRDVGDKHVQHPSGPLLRRNNRQLLLAMVSKRFSDAVSGGRLGPMEWTPETGEHVEWQWADPPVAGLTGLMVTTVRLFPIFPVRENEK